MASLRGAQFGEARVGEEGEGRQLPGRPCGQAAPSQLGAPGALSPEHGLVSSSAEKHSLPAPGLG